MFVCPRAFFKEPAYKLQQLQVGVRVPPPRGEAVRRARSQGVPRSGLRSAPGSSSPPDPGREVPHPQPRGPSLAGKQSQPLLTAREGGPYRPRSSAPAAAPTRVLTELDAAAWAGSREKREKGWEGRGGTGRGTREQGPPGPEALTSALPSRAGRGAWMGSRREPRGPSCREGGRRAGIRAPGCGLAAGRERGGSADLRGGGVEDVRLHPRQRGWAAGARRRGALRGAGGSEKAAPRVCEGGWGTGVREAGAGGSRDEKLAPGLDGPHLRTIRPRVVWVWSKAQRGLKLYVIFSYTRDPPGVQMVSITGGKKRLFWYA